MRLYIIGSNKLGTINIKDKNEESVSTNYRYNKQLEFPINVEKSNGKWNLVKNDYIDIEYNGSLQNSVPLENYGLYFLNILKVNSKIALIPTPTFEQKNYNLVYNELNQFTVGRNSNNNISYDSPLIQDIHAVIKKENNLWTIESQNGGLVYINNYAVNKSILKTGDRIFINGIKIIWNDSFIRVNCLPNMGIKGFRVYDNANNNQGYTPENELESFELYKEEDYYYPKLLIVNNISEEEVNIDTPPVSQEKDDTPLFITIASSITMIGSSFMMVFTIIYNLSNGKATAMIIPQIVMCVAMLFGGLILPRITKGYDKKRSKKKEKLRLEKYGKYLEDKKTEILNIINKQEVVMKENFPSAAECCEFIKGSKISNIKFWSRNNKDDNFINLRLGFGEMDALIKINAPEKTFSLEEDQLLEQVYALNDNSKKLHNVPVTLNLAKNNIAGIMLKDSYKWQYLNGLLIQLMTLHSPYDLKIVVFTNKENEKNWDYIKYLPHSWSDDRQIRFFATNIEEMQKVSEYLSNEYKNRKTNIEAKQDDSLEVNADKEKFNNEDSYKNYEPYYLLIDDNYIQSKNTLIVDLLNETATNYGFSYLGIGEELKDFPNSCEIFVNVNEKNGNILEKKMNNNKAVVFENEYANIDMRSFVNQISNIPIKIKDQDSSLPQMLQFLEMLDVSRVNQLNVLNRWKTSNPVISLATPVGVHKNGEKFKLDLHEKAHGPHGLVAGMTGSGKSEFIITYILSMIINYHPYEVQFVLIDYKGGGLAGAFENKEQGYKIPHLVGTITNLDTAEMNRTLVSIESECKRRQQIFNQVRDKLGESTIDIYKYQKLYREGLIDEPMAHLFIISDEFAELKAQQPDFMNQLISVARIGRSLGIHLILATQKPSGVVNDQIWSNSKFKVCLKVQDKSDSMEMLKKPDAASIKETGRFYLQVGYDDYFDIGQSAWSGAKYVPTNNVIKKIDDSINYVNNTGESYKTIKNIVKADTTEDLGDQLTNIVKYICETATNEKISTNTLWLDQIPETIYVDNLKKKYGYAPVAYDITPVIGEYDDPSNQQQGLLTLDLSSGNTLIYGQTGSGKELLLSTIISSISLEHNPAEANIYILDLGSEALRVFNSIPHVGDIATLENPEKVEDTFNMLYDIMDERKQLFANYSGSYNDYIRSSGQKLPLIVVILNNYDMFAENFPKLSDAVSNIYRDCTKYGIVFVVTALTASTVRGRLASFFTNKITLQLPNYDDYRTILNSPRGLIPSKYYGRGLVEFNDGVYEFQTAQIVVRDKFNEAIRTIGKKMSEAYHTKAKPIPTIPSVVLKDSFNNQSVTLDKIPIGYEMESKKIATYNMNNLYNSIVTENMTDDRMSFVYSFIDIATRIPNSKVRVIDLIDVYEKENKNITLYKGNIDDQIVTIYNDIVNSVRNNVTDIYVFLGIGQLKKVLNTQSVDLFNKLFLSLKQEDSVKIVFVDTYVSFKNLGTEQWYQACVDNGFGIWLGENIGAQMAINVTNLSMEDRKVYFPYIAFNVHNSKHKIIRHMIEEVEQNEE